MIHLNELKKGSYLLYRNEPCEILDIGIVVTGTHSHSKCKATIKGIFSGFQEVLVKSHHETVEELEIIRKKATVIAKANDTVQIMDAITFVTMDSKVSPQELDDYNEGDEITYIDFNNQVKILGKR